jgi:hypothetical protein
VQGCVAEIEREQNIRSSRVPYPGHGQSTVAWFCVIILPFYIIDFEGGYKVCEKLAAKTQELTGKTLPWLGKASNVETKFQMVIPRRKGINSSR